MYSLAKTPVRTNLSPWAACAAAIALLAVTGCVTPRRRAPETKPVEVRRLPYFEARWLDFRDMVSAGGGIAQGIIVTVQVPWFSGPATIGVGAAKTEIHAVTDREYVWRQDWQVGLPASLLWLKSREGECIFPGWKASTLLSLGWLPVSPPVAQALSLFGLTSFALKGLDHEATPFGPKGSRPWQSISRNARIKLGVGALLYGELGIHLAEMLDFVLGWTTLDLASDDSEKI